MGPSCGSSCRLGLDGLRSTSASSFLHCLRDSEPRPRVSKSDKIAVEGRGTQIWDPGRSRGCFLFGSGLYFLRAGRQLSDWSLGHCFFVYFIW